MKSTTSLTIAQLGDLYGLSAEARVRDGVRLLMGGVDPGNGDVVVDRRVVGLDFRDARVTVTHGGWRVVELAHCGRYGLRALGEVGGPESWEVSRGDVVEVENGSAPATTPD